MSEWMRGGDCVGCGSPIFYRLPVAIPGVVLMDHNDPEVKRTCPAACPLAEQTPAEPPEPEDQAVRQALRVVSAPRTPLRAMLSAQANDLLAAGHAPGEVAAMIEQGSDPEDV